MSRPRYKVGDSVECLSEGPAFGKIGIVQVAKYVGLYKVDWEDFHVNDEVCTKFYEEPELKKSNMVAKQCLDYYTNGVPNPGSDDARKQLCSCAISDNHYGLGFPYGEPTGIDADGKPIRTNCFWMSQDCPIHGTNARLRAESEGGNED